MELFKNIDRLDVEVINNGLLPQELVEQAETTLHEKREWIEGDVQALRDMVVVEPFLKAKTDTTFLLTFLRARKFDYEKALSMVVSYYKSWYRHRDIYSDLSTSALSHLWPSNLQTVLSQPDNGGRTVILFTTAGWNPDVLPVDDLIKSLMLILEHVVRLPLTQLSGVNVLVDCSGLSVSHFHHITTSKIKKLVELTQDIFPIRLSALHFIKEHTVFEWLFSLIKPFISASIQKRIHFHGDDLSELHRIVDKNILPTNFGGLCGAMDNSLLLEHLHKSENYFEDHFSYGFDESYEEDVRGCRRSSVLSSIAFVGSSLGTYYRRLCIE